MINTNCKISLLLCRCQTQLREIVIILELKEKKKLMLKWFGDLTLNRNMTKL